MIERLGLQTSLASTLRLFPDDFIGVERRLFLIGLLIKIGVGAVLSSTFLIEMFVPFAQEFAREPFQSPYSTFVLTGNGQSFPYPAAMLYILAIPATFVQFFDITSPVIILLAYRLVLLSFDVAIFFTLRGLLTYEKSKRLIWLYWLSPVPFYISYVHGQLDVIPIAFVVLALPLILSGRYVVSALLLGLAISAKTSVLLIVPVFLLYCFIRTASLVKTAQFMLISLLMFVALNLPLMRDPAFIDMVFFNQEQAKVFSRFIGFGETNFQLVLAAWIMLLVLALRVGIANRNLFVMFLGFFFCVVLLLIPPMHGWYYWIIPFFAFFFANEKNTSPILFFGIQGLYFLYFLVSPNADYLQVFQIFTTELPPLGTLYHWLDRAGFDADLLNDVVFTFLQTSLLLLCVQVYRRGIRKYRDQKITGRPFLLGIGGNSGVGKSRLTDAIEGVFQSENMTILRGDDRHKWARGQEQWKKFTHLNPKANFLHEEVAALRKLKSGQKIWRRIYDHNTGSFTEKVPVLAKKMIILEGLHSFYLSDQRALFDLSIFLAPEETLATHWKICRDMKKRRYNSEQVTAQIDSRRADVERHINSQQKFADIVITPFPDRAIEPVGEDGAIFEINYEITLSNRIYIDEALDLMSTFEGLDIHHEYENNDNQRVTIKGTCDKDCHVAMQTWFEVQLRHIGAQKADWPKDLFGVVLFIIIHSIFQDAENAR